MLPKLQRKMKWLKTTMTAGVQVTSLLELKQSMTNHYSCRRL